MRFRLHYRGPLKSNGDPQHKQDLRRHFRRQLSDLWQQRPLTDHKKFLDPDYELTAIKRVGDCSEWVFSSVVNEAHDLIAELDVVLLRPEEPGNVVTQGEILTID